MKWFFLLKTTSFQMFLAHIEININDYFKKSIKKFNPNLLVS